MTDSINAIFNSVNTSLSVFNGNSLISLINKNKGYRTDAKIEQVLATANKVSAETNGALDVTVAPFVNLWGFGFEKSSETSPHKIDSIKKFVGWQKMRIVNHHIVKEDKRMEIDLSSIAKGYAVDLVANCFRRNGIRNFMIEVGGEIVTNGTNKEDSPWNIGISTPADDSTQTDNHIQVVVHIKNMAMATSGNYRRFYYRDGQKYAHTIDPATGHPVNHSLLSATVFAPNCTLADAYATAFMVMGKEKTLRFVAKHSELMVYLISTGKDGKYNVWHSPSLKKYIADKP